MKNAQDIDDLKMMIKNLKERCSKVWGDDKTNYNACLDFGNYYEWTKALNVLEGLNND